MTTTYGHGTGPRAQQELRDRRLRQERLDFANDLARWAGEEARRAHVEDVAAQPEGRHYSLCCEHAHEDAARDEYAFALELPLETLRERWAAELAERAVRRARRDGVVQ